MKGKGILLTDDYDLLVQPVTDANGRIVRGVLVGETLYQNQAVILQAQPGEIKELPVLGVAIMEALLDVDYTALRRRIRQHIELDGQKVNSVIFSQNKNLEIDASYNR